MKKFMYKKINAFTSRLSQGNPAVFIDLVLDTLSNDEMLHIAKEHQGFVSEVVFANREKTGLIKLTYFSSECEVNFCGHGTIATMYEIIKNDNVLMGLKEIEINTNKKGKLKVYNEIINEDAIYITAPDPVMYGTELTRKEIAQALMIETNQISKDFPIDVIDAGLKTLIVPITSFNTEVTIYPDIHNLKLLCENNDIDIILIFSLENKNVNVIAHTRVFAPKFGYLEDPATGSGNSAFGYYLIKNKMWDNNLKKIEQGGDDRVFNEIKLKVVNGKILFGGKATIKISGTYFL
ncbi:MAG: PhzF family phenazine biosynthesis protein [Spirochaetia bacterium]|nr:PhzF family phenazine biosynthesis protein [Spirochaetia bacterium]